MHILLIINLTPVLSELKMMDSIYFHFFFHFYFYFLLWDLGLGISMMSHICHMNKCHRKHCRRFWNKDDII